MLRRVGDEMQGLLDAHNDLLITAAREHDGVFIEATGDGLFFVFADASCAVAAAVAAQLALTTHEWPKDGELRVRMGLHRGPARPVGRTYVSLAVNQAARICAAAHGGQILVSDDVRDNATLPDEVTVSRLGSFRLKDFDAAVPLSQLNHPALRSEFPALPTALHPGHNLPLPTTSFVGRSDELRDLCELQPLNRFICVVGPGGSGKTRLVFEFATTVASEYPDGVWVVPLGGLAPGASIIDAVSAMVGAREQADDRGLASLLDRLEARRLLLVLDNCEHVLDDVGTLVESVLSRCSRVSIVATSRERVGIAGELVYRLEPLRLPSLDTPIAELSSFDSIDLFIARATLAYPRFTLTDENAPDVATICRQTDGIPLAIELAAARMSILSARAIATGLERGISLLRRRGGDDRHRTLHDTLMWSHGLLDDPERALWRRLSVFVGSFGWDAVVQVMGEDEVSLLEVFSSLLDKSLVARSGEDRYQLHETVRSFAKDLLVGAGEHEAYAQRHAQWAYSVVRDLYGRPANEERAAQYALERENLLAAWAFWREQPVTEQWLRMSAAIGRLAGSTGRMSEAGRVVMAAIERATIQIPGRAELFSAAAWVFDYLDEWERAEEYARWAASEGAVEDDVGAIQTGRYVLANLLQRRGQNAEALEQYQMLLALAHAYEDRSQQAAVLSGVAMCNWALGDTKSCREHGEELIRTARAIGDVRAQGLGYIRLAMAADLDQAPAEYARRMRSAWELAEKSGDPGLVAETSLCLAECVDEVEARTLAITGVEIILACEVSVDADWLFMLARAAASAGDPSLAAQFLGALRARLEHGDALAPPDERSTEALTERLRSQHGDAKVEAEMAAGRAREDLLSYGLEILRRRRHIAS